MRSGADIQALEALPHRLPPARRARARACAAGPGETSTGRSPPRAGATLPLVLSGGLTPENVAEAIAARAPVRRRRRASGTEARPGSRTPTKLRGVRRRGRAAPDAAGAERERARRPAVEHRFGPYGGQYVPETLMPALAELEAAWLDARDDPAYRARARRACCATSSGGPTPLYLAERLSEAAGRERLAQARGPATTPARTRSTTRSARRCSPGGWASRGSSPRPAPGQHGVATRDRLRAARPRVRRLHGRGGHPPPAAQRPADGAARRARSSAVEAGRADAQGGGVARRSATGSRTSATRTTSSARPSARRRIPAIVRDLQRVIGDEARAAAARADGPAARPRDRVRRRRLERDRDVRRASSTTRASSSSASRRRARASRPAATARR